jgi:hypothetical protein
MDKKEVFGAFEDKMVGRVNVVKDHRDFERNLGVDVEKELLSLGYSVAGRSSGFGGGSFTLYTKEAGSPDLYNRPHVLPSLNTVEYAISRSPSVFGYINILYRPFRGSYASHVVRSEDGEVVRVFHGYTYTFFVEAVEARDLSVFVELSGELDAPMPKGNPVSCKVHLVINIGPVPLTRDQKRRTKELILKFSEALTPIARAFPEADVYAILETRVGRGGVKKSLSRQYLGKAGEVFYSPPPQWPEEEDSGEDSVDGDYDLEEDDPWDSDSEEDEFEEEEDE